MFVCMVLSGFVEDEYLWDQGLLADHEKVLLLRD